MFPFKGNALRVVQLSGTGNWAMSADGGRPTRFAETNGGAERDAREQIKPLSIVFRSGLLMRIKGLFYRLEGKGVTKT